MKCIYCGYNNAPSATKCKKCRAAIKPKSNSDKTKEKK